MHCLLNGKKHLLVMLGCLLVFALSSNTFAEDDAPAVTPVYVELDPDFIVNYSSSGTKLSYIKTRISLRTDTAKEGTILSNMPIVRDALVMFLSSRSKDQVTGAIAREETRAAAKQAINEALKEETGTEPVMDVLFASFVTQ